ncbi:hypothetical protein [Streptomyces sp. XD-27]|uniref:hypothetical protein n=1 Tax=Streptomyces sp. XD-27 TaxID=3062779 RepID=UPI0026F43F9E|nr:hypothetical protein [Streptomyces sp. XD-27]WKX70018.1 hypothetical protein Q3Y56_08935 [Streptomyces sp. XD-27]
MVILSPFSSRSKRDRRAISAAHAGRPAAARRRPGHRRSGHDHRQPLRHAPRAPASPPRPSVGEPAPKARWTAPPGAPCTAIPAGTVKQLVPGAKPGGSLLKTTDARRRTGCSWHALHGYDYRWLDVTYDIRPQGDSASGGGSEGDGREDDGGEPVPGLGDTATVSERVTTDDGQRTREAVVVVRVSNAVVTVTYSGSDFESGKAPDADVIREGALTAARTALKTLR